MLFNTEACNGVAEEGKIGCFFERDFVCLFTALCGFQQKSAPEGIACARAVNGIVRKAFNIIAAALRADLSTVLTEGDNCNVCTVIN